MSHPAPVAAVPPTAAAASSSSAAPAPLSLNCNPASLDDHIAAVAINFNCLKVLEVVVEMDDSGRKIESSVTSAAILADLQAACTVATQGLPQLDIRALQANKTWEQQRDEFEQICCEWDKIINSLQKGHTALLKYLDGVRTTGNQMGRGVTSPKQVSSAQLENEQEFVEALEPALREILSAHLAHMYKFIKDAAPVNSMGNRSNGSSSSSSSSGPLKVLILNSGGTMTMTTKVVAQLKNGKIEHNEVRTCRDQHMQSVLAELRQPARAAQLKPLFNMAVLEDSRIVFKDLPGGLLDSSEMGPEGWSRIAMALHRYSHEYKGFVVLHGTDTMAYTASALTFMMTELRKPVILTGSQAPLLTKLDREVDVEALNNLVWSCEFASASAADMIPAVLVFFHRRLMLGCRVTKMSADEADVDAFDCPKVLPLVQLQGKPLQRLVNAAAIQKLQTKKQSLKPPSLMPFVYRPGRQVALIRLFPGITGSFIRSIVGRPSDSQHSPAVRGVVLQTFGGGNGPMTTRADFRLALSHLLAQKRVIVAFVTECLKGGVENDYTSGVGNKLLLPGILACSDMTTEAAFSKLTVLMANNSYDLAGVSDPDDVLDVAAIRKKMSQNMHGETADTPGSADKKKKSIHKPNN